MNKRFLIFLAFMIFMLSCESIIPPTATATSTFQPPTATRPASTVTLAAPDFITTTPFCISTEPTQADIDRALSYTGDTFGPPTWKRTYSVAEYRVTVTWLNDRYGALASLEALTYPCGYGEQDINAYFSNEGWQAIFANYESYQPVDECRKGTGLRLYQFTVKNQSIDYALNYWVQNDTDTRLVTLMLVFPITEQTTLEDTSTRLFPDLPNCPK